MSTQTATAWAWRAIREHARGRLDAPHRLTLLAACHLLDEAAAAADRDMFHHDVLDQAVVGFHPTDIAPHVGVTGRTVDRYCLDLVAAGLLTRANTPERRYALPHPAWVAATIPSSGANADRSPDSPGSTVAGTGPLL